MNDIRAMYIQDEKEESKKEGIKEGEIKGEIKGIKKGKIEGKIEGKAEDILILLESLGPVPDELSQKIMKVTDEQSQVSLLKLAAKVNSLEEYSHRMNEILK